MIVIFTAPFPRYLSGGSPAYSLAKSEKLSIMYFFSISAGGESFSPFFQDRLM